MGYIREGMQAIKNGPKNSVKKMNNKNSMTKGRMRKTTRRSGRRRRRSRWPVPKGRK